MRRILVKWLLLLSCVFPLVSTAGCGGKNRGGVVTIDSEIREDSAALRSAAESGDGGDGTFRRWTEAELTSGVSLSVVSFLNPEYGWVGGPDGTFHRTEDGGKTWTPLRVELPSGGWLTSVSLISNSDAWASATRSTSDALDVKGEQGSILFTKDGGKSWQTQYKSDSTQIYKVRFAGGQEGWAVGRRLAMEDVRRDYLLVLHTTDGGLHWADVSGELNRIAADSGAGVQDFASDVFAAEPGKAAVLSVGGKIFSTSDGGRSWEGAGVISDEPQQTFVSRLGYTRDKRAFVLGGADSREGIWGMLAQQRADGSWVKYRTDARLSDAFFITDTQILACGSMAPNETKPGRRDEREGVILYTNDGGRNWTVVYRNPKVQSINAMTGFDRHHIWAVGDNGLVLKLNPPPGKE